MIADAAIGAVLAAATLLPLAWKWKLGVPRVAAAVLALAVAWGLLVGAAGVADAVDPVPGSGLVWLLTVASAFVFLAFRFYRDPERRAPDRADAIVSPADGEVVYVRSSEDGKLPVATKAGRRYALEELTKTPLESMNAIVVGISLSFLDVHVNRAPIGGTVAVNHHSKGTFKSLGRPESIFENERATTVIERDGLQVAVVLIASRLVRRIVSFVREGEQVACGERIGAIRFGSQVDLVIPAVRVLELHVRAGDRVTAGESIVAVIGPEHSPGEGSGRAAPAVRDRRARPTPIT